MKRNTLKAIGFTLLGTVGLSSSAYASGFSDIFRNFTDVLYVIAVTVTALGFVGGILAFLYAGKLMWDRSGDRGADVELMRVVWAVVAGSFLLGLGWVSVKGVETLGGNSGSVGAQVGRN